MAQKLMGIKRKMIQRFDDEGKVIVCTIVEVEPNVIAQVKTKERDGYEAIQIACGEIKAGDERTALRRAGKPRTGHFKKASLSPRRYLQECFLAAGQTAEVGQELTVSLFSEGDFVDVVGLSKGRGYQGVMRLHGFRGGPAAHGSGFHRHAGSTGMRSTPGRCLPGGKRASRMGGRRRTVQNLRVVHVDEEKGVMLIEGSVPGSNGSLVTISPAVKRVAKKR